MTAPIAPVRPGQCLIPLVITLGLLKFGFGGLDPSICTLIGFSCEMRIMSYGISCDSHIQSGLLRSRFEGLQTRQSFCIAAFCGCLFRLDLL